MGGRERVTEARRKQGVRRGGVSWCEEMEERQWRWREVWEMCGGGDTERKGRDGEGNSRLPFL